MKLLHFIHHLGLFSEKINEHSLCSHALRAESKMNLSLILYSWVHKIDDEWDDLAFSAFSWHPSRKRADAVCQEYILYKILKTKSATINRKIKQKFMEYYIISIGRCLSCFDSCIEAFLLTTRKILKQNNTSQLESLNYLWMSSSFNMIL